MGRGIELEVIGDSSLFTRLGKGVGYLVSADGAEYLVDCGATPFRALGHDGINSLRGLIATHSHEDHRRWFTDLVLYLKYHPACRRKLTLITSEKIHEEYEKNSRGALEISLSADSRRVVDVPYSEFVEKVVIGPLAKYAVKLCQQGSGGRVWRAVETATGEPAPPSLAKVVVNPAANRPRMLFKDPDIGEWVEPESYYPFSSRTFYEPDRNDVIDETSGLRIRAVKAPAWHGPPTIGLLFSRGAEKVAFSSDTVYDMDLWRELVDTKRPRPPEVQTHQFEEAYVLRDDINRYIERTWSEERFQEALKCFDGAVVVHDADFEASIVHTSLSKLEKQSSWRKLLLTHTPERFCSQFPITATGKRYVFEDGDVLEIAGCRRLPRESGRPEGGTARPLEADVYFKDADGLLYVGYEAAEGIGRLWDTPRGATMTIGTDAPPAPEAKLLGRYDVYRDIDGEYYPALTERGSYYRIRTDGKVEAVSETADTSRGRLAEDRRGRVR